MILSVKGEIFLRKSLLKHEGLKLQPYRDSRGFLTIGIGHKITADDNREPITEKIALDLFKTDINKAEMDIMQSATFLSIYKGLDDIRKALLIEMVFQMGIEGVLKFVDFLQNLAEKDYEGAHDEMVKSKWFEECPNRVTEMADCMRTGIPYV